MARAQDLGLLRTLKYEPILRAGIASYVREPHEVDALLLNTYAQLLQSGSCLPVEESSLCDFALRTAQTLAHQSRIENVRFECPTDYVSMGALECDSRAMQAFDRARVLSTFEHLSPQSRQILALYRIERMTERDIAERLEIAPDEVNRRLTGALCEYARALFSGPPRLSSTDIP